MITRRQFGHRLMVGTSVPVVLSIAACSQLTGGLTLGELAAKIQTVCGFRTSIDYLAAVAVSFVGASFNPAAALAADLAKKIEDGVCGAVMAHPTAQTNALRLESATAGHVITVIVNGVQVKGELTAKRP
jgi:hypothetical protein